MTNSNNKESMKSRIELKKFIYIVSCVALLMALPSCGPKEDSDPIKNIDFEDDIELEVGNTYDLSDDLYVVPASVKLPVCTFTSDNKSVATVSRTKGVVTAVAPGLATITAETEDGKHKAYCDVKVVNPKVAVSSVNLSPTTMTLQVGKSQPLTATVLPENATNKSVKWSSSAPTVASVDGGMVQALSAGSTTITVTTDDGGKTATCAVTVGSPTPPALYIDPYLAFGSSATKTAVKNYENGKRTLAVEENNYLVFAGESNDVLGVYYEFSGSPLTLKLVEIWFTKTASNIYTRAHDYLASKYSYQGKNSDGDEIFYSNDGKLILWFWQDKDGYWNIQFQARSSGASSSVKSSMENIKIQNKIYKDIK
jgi:hypothetical protein